MGPRAARHEPVRRLRDRPARPRRGGDAAPAPGPRRGRRDGPRGRRRDRVHRGRDGQRARPPRSPDGIVAVRADDRRRRAAAVRRPGHDRVERAARSSTSMADLDGRPIGSVDLAGDRAGDELPLAGLRGVDAGAGPPRRGPDRERGVGPRAVQRAGGGASSPRSPTARSTSRRSRPRSARRPATRPSSTASTSSRAPGPRTAGSRSTARRSGGRSRRSPGSSATPSWRAGGASSTTGSSSTASSAG